MQKVLEKLVAATFDWDSTRNPQIHGNIKTKSPSHYMENIADILFHYDITLTHIFQNFDALNIHDSSSYENLIKSISISPELTEFVNEFLVSILMLSS